MPAHLNRDTIEPEDLTAPPCPHFGPCGGCQLQDLTYPAQLKLKASQLRALLAPLDIALPEIHLHPSPPLAYRNRIRLTLGEVSGQMRAGYIRSDAGSCDENSQPFLPITECPIAAPVLWRAAQTFLGLVDEHRTSLVLAQYIPDQLEIFTTADEARLQLTLYLRTQAKSLPKELSAAYTAVWDDLGARIPELSGAGIALLAPLSAERSRRAATVRSGPSWGKPGLNYRVGGLVGGAGGPDYWVPRGAFFQANRYLLPELLALVTANRSGSLAWDLYAGVGLFSRALAHAFDRVTAVEAAEPAATAVASTGLANLHAIKANTLDYLRAAVIERDRPDLVVLDPPRAGAGADVCALLARVAAPALVYVSCSPQTLTSDLKVLAASGYRVGELHLVDLFPQTTHIETVAILHR